MNDKRKLKEGLFTLATLYFMYILNILMQDIFYTKTLIPMLFVLGVFFISECDTHRWSQSEMPCRSGDQRVRSPPFSSVTDYTHALPMTLKFFYFLKN